VTKKIITLLTSGTRGDVLPYIALGKGLQQAGYQVNIAAPIGFANLIQQHTITFKPFEGNPSDLLIEQGNSTPLTLGKNFIHSIQSTKKFIEQAHPLYKKMLQTAFEACKNSDLLIYGLPTLWGAHIAEGLRIPAIRALLQPLVPTNQFASALLPFRFSFPAPLAVLGGRIINWLSHFIITQMIYLSWRKEINYARQNLFQLGSAPLLDSSLRNYSSQPLTLNGFSEQIIPRPKDGFGSPGTKGFSQTLSILEKALSMTNAQAILTVPSKWHAEIKSKNIFPVEYVPHEWLYRNVKVAVHHGGAGTTSASLHAGIPTITMPLAIDQFFWGERVYKIGVGPKPIPQRKLTAEKLAHAIQIALADETMNARAKTVSQALSRENGIQVAVSVMREII
jgi:sterol 3beta-glucosyltransferase